MAAEWRTRPQYVLRSYCDAGSSRLPGIEADIASDGLCWSNLCVPRILDQLIAWTVGRASILWLHGPELFLEKNFEAVENFRRAVRTSSGIRNFADMGQEHEAFQPTDFKCHFRILMSFVFYVSIYQI